MFKHLDPEIQSIVDAYLKRSDLCDDDDPIDDFKRLSLVALEILKDKTALEASLRDFQKGHRSTARAKLDRMVDDLSRALHLCNPGISQSAWSQIYRTILTHRYGGETIRITKNPKEKLLSDAKTLTPKELISKHGISRRYAYQLRKEALQKK